MADYCFAPMFSDGVIVFPVLYEPNGLIKVKLGESSQNLFREKDFVSTTSAEQFLAFLYSKAISALSIPYSGNKTLILFKFNKPKSE